MGQTKAGEEPGSGERAPAGLGAQAGAPPALLGPSLVLPHCRGLFLGEASVSRMVGKGSIRDTGPTVWAGGWRCEGSRRGSGLGQGAEPSVGGAGRAGLPGGEVGTSCRA